MTEDILNIEYWKRRLESSRCMHEAIFRCPEDRWARIEEQHRRVLLSVIEDSDSILDVGCGWGRLLRLLPTSWDGEYAGVDISPDFLSIAKQTYPHRRFYQGEFLEAIPKIGGAKFDWAIMISIRPMIIRNLGGEIWDNVEQEIRKVAESLLFLEYDPSDEGSIE